MTETCTRNIGRLREIPIEAMTDEELEIYDLLIEDKTLTKAELQKVKLAAKNLYQKLVEKKDPLAEKREKYGVATRPVHETHEEYTDRDIDRLLGR